MAQGLNRRLPNYPATHKVGMVVPRGGSDCAKCEYLNQDTKQDCRQPQFVQWNDGHHIPADVDRYCCDFFETKRHPLQIDTGK